MCWLDDRESHHVLSTDVTRLQLDDQNPDHNVKVIVKATNKMGHSINASEIFVPGKLSSKFNRWCGVEFDVDVVVFGEKQVLFQNELKTKNKFLDDLTNFKSHKNGISN